MRIQTLRKSLWVFRCDNQVTLMKYVVIERGRVQKYFSFITLKEAQTELFNLNCRMLNFIHSLKERCDLDPQGTVLYFSHREK
jgi:hypothetical protein